MLKFSLLVGFMLFIFTPSRAVYAAVDEFIFANKTASYDCPDQDNFAELEQILENQTVTDQQRFSLNVEKAQFLICDGKAGDAQSLLFSVLESSDIDKTSYFYASAMYQIGFSYDVQEKPERCQYYERAKNLSSKTLHPDIYLSAQLGVAINCLGNNDVSTRLKEMYRILYSYLDTDDKAALAHIHNSIGLVYGDIEQYAMAAEQYRKAHEIGKDIYTGGNKLSILISVVITQLASGQLDAAFDTILLLEQLNQELDLPLTNFYYNHALASYYYRLGDFQQMEAILPKLRQYAEPLDNSFIESIVAWYSVVPCAYAKDKACIQQYFDENPNPPFTSNQLFHSLVLRMHLVLGNEEETADALDAYDNIVLERYYKAQDSAGILSVANLYSEIENLESEIEQAKLAKTRLIYASIAISFILCLSIALYGRKRYLRQLSIDPVTQLLNSKTLFTQILRVPAPESGKTNALALFNLTNFKVLNQLVGSTNSDQMLQKIAYSLKRVTRGTDILGRFAPEQFVLCLHNIEENNAKLFFERVQNQLDNTEFFTEYDKTLGVDSNMSVFTTTERFSDLESVFDDMLASLNIG